MENLNILQNLIPNIPKTLIDTDKGQDGIEDDIKVVLTSTLSGRGQNILGVYWHKANRLCG